MRNKRNWTLSLLVVLAAGVHPASAQQTTTMYAPHNKERTTYSESKAWFSFEFGVRGNADKQITGDKWDLGYGFLSIDGEDWFMVSCGNDDRSVIKDLGELNWFDSFNVPALTPLPALENGQIRNITVDASASTRKAWANTNGIFARAIVNHMYLVRIKRSDTDFYAMFRLESIEQQDNCTISWRLILPPER